jgi:hypothetical protein
MRRTKVSMVSSRSSTTSASKLLEQCLYLVLLSVVLPEPTSPRETWPAPESPRTELLLSPAMAEDLPPPDRLPEDMEPDDMDPDGIEPEELPLYPTDPDDILPPVDVSLLLVPIEEPAPMSRVVWANEGALRSAPAAKVAAMAWRRVEVMVECIRCL